MGVRWLADFRDPWTSIGYHKKLKLTKASKRKHIQLEAEVLNTADTVIVTSATTKKEFSLITNSPIVVITNGFDGYTSGVKKVSAEFTIAHIGSLLTGRDPHVLWQVFSELIQENVKFKKYFKLQLVGVVSQDVLEAITSYGLLSHTKVIGYVSHEEAVAYQQTAQVLLLIEMDTVETQGIIPGKLFEYIAAERPILGVGPKDWEVGQLIKETNTGSAFLYSDKNKLKKQIVHWFTLYLEEALHTSSKNIEKYSRRALTEQLAKQL